MVLSHAHCQGQAGAGADFTNLPVPVGEQEVAKTAQDFAERLQNWSCQVLRTGGPLCQVPGMSDVYDSLLTGTLLFFPRAFLGFLRIALEMVTLLNFFTCAEANGYQEMEIDPLEDIIKQDLQVQLTDAFEGMNSALMGMQSDITQYVIARLRMDSLTKVNYSAIPEYDSSHPHWKEDLNTTILEGTPFFEPVGRKSTLQYPDSLNR